MIAGTPAGASAGHLMESLKLELHIVLEGRKNLAGQVYRQLRDAIRDGRLAAGEQLPPTRLPCEQLGLGRTTVSEA